MSGRQKLRCGKCGRRLGVYLDEVSGRYLAHRIPIAFHRATLAVQGENR